MSPSHRSSYQLKQPINNNSPNQPSQFQNNNQAAQGYFAPAPQYVSPPHSPPLSTATGQQMPQFPQHQKELLPQQRQIQAQMQTSNPQLMQTGPPSASKYQTAIPIQCLNDGPAPVDCPACGSREMTRTESDVGNTTQ